MHQKHSECIWPPTDATHTAPITTSLALSYKKVQTGPHTTAEPVLTW